MRRLAIALAAVVALLAVGSCVMIQPVATGERPGPDVSPDPARLEAHVRALSEQFVPRDVEHPENLDRAAAYMRAELERSGGKVTDQPYRVDGREYRNVRARFGKPGGPRIVVGAHYDAFGSFPGADDNASGAAGLLELARALGERAPDADVELVAYTLEEPPHFRDTFMGSRVHAKSLEREKVAVRGMISLEMIGTFVDGEGTQGFPFAPLALFYPDRGNFIAVVGTLSQTALVRDVKRAMRSASELPVHSINAPRAVPRIDWSDHHSYLERGFPAVMVTDTAFYRNERYHTAQDTADRLDYRRMAMVVEGVYAAVWALAER